MVARLIGLALLLGAALFAAPAAACSMREGYRTPTNFELVRQADLIVVARVVSGPTDLNAGDTWVTVEPVRVLKGTLPAEPLRVPGVLGLDGESLPTPLGPSHFSAGMGACIRLFYPQGGLILAMFERKPEGMQPLWAALGRATEDVEAADGVWVRVAEAYAALQRDVSDAGLRAAAETRLAALRAMPDDFLAQAMAIDLQHYLDVTAPGGPGRRTDAGWGWLDMPGAAGALLGAPGSTTGLGLRCERGAPALRADLFGRPGTAQLALEIGGRRFEVDGEARRTLQNGQEESISGTLAFTSALAEAMRTSPLPASLLVDQARTLTAAPGDVLQKLALRCAALLAPGTGAPPAR